VVEEVKKAHLIEAGTTLSGFLTREISQTVVFCFGIPAGGVVESWRNG
jgi:hypothetical protein